MSSDINKVILIGNLTRDPELSHIPSGTAVAKFSIANNRTYISNGEKKKDASFFNCIAWAKLGETITQYCSKGDRVGIEGRLQQRSWDDQSGNKRSTIEIIVDNIQFLTSRSESNVSKPATQNDPVQNSFDDDIPF